MRIIAATVALLAFAFVNMAQAQSDERPNLDLRAGEALAPEPGYRAAALAWNPRGAFSVVFDDSVDNARARALSDCNLKNGTCTLAGSVAGSSFFCVAITRNMRKADNLSYASRHSLGEARNAALEICTKHNGSSCKLEYSACNVLSPAATKPSSPNTPAGAKIPKVLAFSLYDNVVGITIFGPIVSGDDALFRSLALANLRAGKLIGAVRIFSPGGQVEPATNIGAQIRLLQAETAVPLFNGSKRTCHIDTAISKAGQSVGGALGIMTYDAATREGDPRCECESACSLIWAAGVGRNKGFVGVHRFSVGGYANLTMEKAKEVYERELASFRGYLVSMGTPEAVINSLLSTSSAGMRYLNTDELSQMENFPIYLSELILAKCGRRPDPLDLESKRENYRFCATQLYKEKYRAGAKDYLQKYGNGETFKETVAR